MQRPSTNEKNVIDFADFRLKKEAAKVAEETAEKDFLDEIAKYLLMAARAIADRRQQAH
jgi:hypothetical protein